ncbi:STE family protein kinase [Trichomonas vaginalis G3]|uniref:STE family protein kinase n=1 Tax=Trichomonas vaginalis (strain ATCC PRA-98 / G3) TaxID=412133 RepID=A2FXD2_TRIV3|nr:protein serine/threonine kinase protein [Trichomonas vaginalis G3]EAX90437.1 STE family protein kinase [Trichomonas vaginalis G3]KAI5554201.1 protein serine/threonine kinase protein [Trichomonas vaginalis G3]|eukprot:XP_001303367.1 STE family protein kinase [Trichomonas vaginalis G3]
MQVYKYYRYKNFVYILMECCPSEFYSHNTKKISLNSDQLKKYCYEILCAIKMFHDRGISHTDLKPSNFMIDQNGKVKLCQASIASLYERDIQQIDYRDFMLFMSPEVLKRKAYDPMKADIWAVGITFYYIFLHIHPFFADNFKTLIKLVNDGIFPIFAIKDPQFRDVINRCLDYCEETRASVDELLNMPYFASFAITKKPIRERQVAARSHSAIVQNKMLQKLSEISKSRISRVPLTRRLAKTIRCKKD